jgi:hypothetical protein
MAQDEIDPKMVTGLNLNLEEQALQLAHNAWECCTTAMK